MDSVIISSMRKSAGKTSLIVGMAKALKKKIGYMKPFGHRLLYKKKRLWDYDSALMAGIFDLKEEPEDMSIGFDYSKLRYMYDEESTRKKILESSSKIGKGKDLLIIESAGDIRRGSSVHLDAISLAKYTKGRLFFVISGGDDLILDDLAFVKKYVDMKGVDFGGVILNKVHNLEEFKSTHLKEIEKMGIEVVGMVPHTPELTHFTVSYLAEALFAKVLTGEQNLNRTVKTVFIGAMSANVALSKPVFKKEAKVIITGGDRSDMILAALESDAVAVVLTGNLLPQPDIISKAAEKGMPLLMVPFDTFETARRIDNMEPMLVKEDSARIELLEKLAKEHIDLKKIMG
ncbi:MAG: DRTGG domain-containing protein [Candidatus Micrarchaeota archaeon]|nr:DRTGG domain-containing protein [Candidatus Micrarchaeota archaeon]